MKEKQKILRGNFMCMESGSTARSTGNIVYNMVKFCRNGGIFHSCSSQHKDFGDKITVEKETTNEQNFC